jgi:hypothetical protein
MQNMHADVQAKRRASIEKHSQYRWVNAKPGSWHFNCSWGTHATPITVAAECILSKEVFL